MRLCSKLTHRVAKDLRGACWEFPRVTTDKGSEFRNHRFDEELDRLGVLHTLIRPGRPQANGFAERVQRTILEDAGSRPSPAT